MGLFNKSPKPSPFSLDEKPETPPAQNRTEEQVRSMAGFSSASEVAAAAPSSTSAPEIATPRGRKPSSARTTAQPQPVAPSAADLAKEAARREAMATIGRATMKELANLPYDVWAFMAADPDLRLSPQEQKDLSDAYFGLAQSINPDFTKPGWAVAFIIITNAKLVGVRLKAQALKTKSPEKQKEEAESGKAILN